MSYRIDFIKDGEVIGSMPVTREDLDGLNLGSWDEMQIDMVVYSVINVSLNFDTMAKTLIAQVFVR